MFKVGDKVKCIDNTNAYHSLTMGEIYTVVKIVEDNRICLAADEVYGWHPARFKKVEEVKDNYIILESKPSGKWWLKNPQIKDINFIGNIAYFKDIDTPIRVINNYEIRVNNLITKKCTEEEFLNAEKEFLSIKKPIVVKLNSSYNAIVSKDKIAVGCQTFSVDIVKDLAKALEELN